MRIITLFALLFISAAATICAVPSAQFTYHTVEKGETMYSISRQYGIKPAELARYNNAPADNFTIKIGQKLKVPAKAGDESQSPQDIAAKVAPNVAPSVTYHIVKKGDTFYSIARQYGIERTDLQMWNDLGDMSLKVGQKLMIKKASAESKEAPKATPASTPEQGAVSKKQIYANAPPRVIESNVSTSGGDVTASSSSVGLASTKVVKSWKAESVTDRMEENKVKTVFDPANEYESLYYQNVYSGLTKKTETGVAKLIADNNAAHIAYYNNASIGTILRLTNPDNGKTAYAIVVGKIPAAENNAYMVKVSEKVARNLSVKDYTSVEVICYTGN